MQRHERHIIRVPVAGFAVDGRYLYELCQMCSLPDMEVKTLCKGQLDIVSV